jgi:ElaB/YqjD/DUF883 family membrane-anchored ribosome-binding protein
MTKNTLNDLLARLAVDVDNMNSFIFSLQNMLESKSENVSIDQTLTNGNKVTINVPSFGYMKGKIDDINTRFDTLISANSDTIGIKSSNGDIRKFELKKTSQLLSELEAFVSTEYTVPTSFKVKNNWFFESFLNPLLYVSLDISTVLTNDIDKFAVKRIIFSATDTVSQDYFDANYKGKNDISLPLLKADLNNSGVDFFEDDNEINLGVAINRYKGTFDVVKILDEDVTQTLSTGTTTSVSRRRYKLNTLNYTDALSGTKNSKFLAVNDVLVTQNDSEYKVISINKTDTEIILERIFGVEPINIGADQLRIKPVPYRVPELQVNVGFNEREVIFIKPISRAQNLTIDDYANGIAIYTNELTIPLNDNTVTTLEKYYTDFVSDFGLILLNMAKEKQIPAILGETPDAPVLNIDNFKVTQIDKHIQEDKNIQLLNADIATKSGLENEIDELNKKIESLKSSITSTSKTQAESKRLEKELTQTRKELSEKSTALSTTVNNITTRLSTTPQFVTAKQYAVQGFWAVPSAKSTTYGTQEIVQFNYRFRYLSQTGTQPDATQYKFLDTDGANKTASFSPWTEVKSSVRPKQLNDSTGLYNWQVEDISNSEVVNSNQLSIPIRKGEIVEIQVQSISEAGWPINPLVSDWSEAIQVEFPAEISSTEESTITSQTVFADKVKIDFEQSLNAKGLDSHLSNQFTTGDRFFSHKAQDISSGFFTSEGNVVDLYQELNNLRTTIDGLLKSISTGKGELSVSLIDSDGTVTKITNGSNIELFAGYYRDLIKDTTGGTTVYNDGKVITKQYVISIQNTSATPLQLVSLLFANSQGIDLLSTTSNPAIVDSDYHVNRRYDIVPISVNTNPTGKQKGIKHTPGNQSGQVLSQWLNSRYKTYGLSDELYYPDLNTNQYPPVTLSYNYQGRLISGELTPTDWAHYLPYKPGYTVPSTSQDPQVWNGIVSLGTPSGNGYLSEFCISKDHPKLKELGVTYDISSPSNLKNLFEPSLGTPSVSATQKYLPFSHALHFETSVSDSSDVFGAPYYSQASRVTPALAVDDASRNVSNYPIKLGFTPNDEYLIGKYTCGSYLYMFPNSYAAVSVDGNFANRSTKELTTGSDKALNIPVLFQFRCSDKLGYVGGYRTGETLSNIKYSKKIGLDIILKDDSPFSFDLTVSAQYAKETSSDAPYIQSQGKLLNF